MCFPSVPHATAATTAVSMQACHGLREELERQRIARAQAEAQLAAAQQQLRRLEVGVGGGGSGGEGRAPLPNDAVRLPRRHALLSTCLLQGEAKKGASGAVTITARAGGRAALA